MKLLLVAAMLTGFTGLAAADNYAGPPGEAPVVVQGQGPVQPIARPMRRGNGEFRRALMDRFDRNHDGRLEPRERRQAARALRKLAKKLARQDRQQLRAQRRQPQAGGPNVDVYVD